MELWIVRVSWFDEGTVVGVATSALDAEALVMRAMLSDTFKEYDASDYRILGPFAPNQIHNSRGVQL